ncbi:DUF3558 family protein [Solihabitans fulvus]|uniref:DUF3558 family protein n=1 Tax=Solihabitans fulvus TaxID=1892852 RepID=UPI001661A49C|nr:DUF3558 family protein [Solihabitans fulvus]
MPRLPRPVLAVVSAVSALAVLAGCGAGADLAKKTYPRSTVPAAAAPVASKQPDSTATRSTAPSGQPTGPAYATDKLRLVDPCKLFDPAVLSTLGTPAEQTNPDGFSGCSDFMKDKQGTNLGITVKVGASLTSEVQEANKKIGDLPSVESKLDGSNACFVTMVTQDNPALGVTIQVGHEAGDPCTPARTVAESVAKQLKNGPPQRTVDKGTLLTVDPCVLPDQAAVDAALGAGSHFFPYGLHNCSWTKAGATVAVDMRPDYDPKDNKLQPNQKPVDLGNGITGYQLAENNSYPTCRLAWLHRKTTGDPGGEVIEIRFDNIDKAPFDPCERSQAFAKALFPKLPKP